MVVYFLAGSMIVLLVISFYANNQEVVSPFVAFLAPFSLATVDLIYNIDKWKVELQWNTYYVIVGGTIIFVLSCWFTKLIAGTIKIHRYKSRGYTQSKKMEIEQPILVNKYNYYCFAILQVITFGLCLIAVVKIARRYGVSGTLSMMIAGYKNLKTFTTADVSLGKINNLLSKLPTM